MADSSNSGINYEEIAKQVENFRETQRALVAGLLADGFTDEQARDIVAGLWRVTGRGDA